jgi:hypothetical protein
VKKLLNILKPKALKCQSDKELESLGIQRLKEMGEECVKFSEARSAEALKPRRITNPVLRQFGVRDNHRVMR